MAVKFPKVVKLDAADAQYILDSTAFYAIAQVAELYDALIDADIELRPSASTQDHMRFAIAAVWCAGRTQGILERTTLSEKMRQHIVQKGENAG